MQETPFDLLLRAKSTGTLSGTTALITGANVGIGYETARLLAEAGAQVVMACRDVRKAEDAKERLKRQVPDARLQVMQLDLADLEQIQAFVQAYIQQGKPLDWLVLNAGIMAPPLQRTAQGFESQMGVNHLGHFALAGGLLSALKAAPKARIAILGSQAAAHGRLDFADLHYAQRSYDPEEAYRQSKLANLVFALGLQSRLSAANLPISAVLVDPGYARTQLQRHVRGLLRRLHVRYTQARYAHPAADAARRVVRALLQDDLTGLFGSLDEGPIHFDSVLQAIDPQQDWNKVSDQLWQISASSTRTTFNFQAS